MSRRALWLCVLAASALGACRDGDEPATPDAPTPDAAPRFDAAPEPPVFYVVRGVLAPEVTGDPMPASPYVEIFDAWEDDHDPFPADAPVLATPTVVDGAYAATVSEESGGLIAAVLVDDAPGAPDLLVPTINDRRVGYTSSGDLPAADVDTRGLARARLAGWQASPATGTFDLESVGVAVVTFLDHDGAPEAGVYPFVGAEARVWFVSADGASLDADAEATTASGRVIVFGALSIAGLDRPPTGDPKDLLESVTHGLVGIGSRPGTVFVETSSRL